MDLYAPDDIAIVSADPGLDPKAGCDTRWSLSGGDGGAGVDRMPSGPGDEAMLGMAAADNKMPTPIIAPRAYLNSINSEE